MVGVARIELATPAMSTQCSTTELHAHPGQPMWLGEAAFREQIGKAQPPFVGLEAAVLVLGLEDAVDLHHQVLEMEWLGQQLRFWQIEFFQRIKRSCRESS